MIKYICNQCSTTYPIDAIRYRCDCGQPLELQKSEIGFPIDQIARRSNTLWRYREALPITDEALIISLGEGMTPLVPFEHPTHDHRLKLDFVFPTGSYKDRGAAILLSKVRELGVREVVEDSSGNAGAAIAAYSARAGLDCTIYCPASTSKGKLTQISMYGAKLKLIEGNRAATTQAVLQTAESIYYASHNWNPFFLEGTKTVAFEVAEQLGWKAPDHVICPVGFGSIYLGLYIGFRELHAQQVITKLPRLLGVQSAACPPIYTAYAEKQSQIERSPQTYETLAEGITSELPIRAEAIINAIRETNGAFTIVDEEEIKAGIKILAAKGIYIEPTSAVIVKAFDKFVAGGIIREGDLTVSILTGSGLKATDKLMKLDT
ncbi:MAG: threonine synthase [Candidatus Poribacteria bacterium]|nr:threonine synthase [Candidatus Poribacteria bacterium]